MKDNFSKNSGNYAKFRPGYPAELFRFLENLVPGKDKAWDCGTGNGQVAVELAKYIQKVYATDISGQQLENAVEKENIEYSQQSAEKTDFPADFFDLICIAQAIHWFDFEEFYKEVKRTLKPTGIIAVMGYSLFKINKKTDSLINYFYKDIIGAYWDDERKFLDEQYKSIPFPFAEIETPEFEHRLEWDFNNLIGYLKTWSAVKHYEKKNNHNPVDLIAGDLKKAFGERGVVRYPVLLRVGMKK